MTERPDLDAIEAILIAATPGPLLSAHGKPLTDGYGLCRVCGNWTPAHHEEAHDHKDDCAARSAERTYRTDRARFFAAAPTALREVIAYARALEADHAVIDTERANYRTESNLWMRTVQEQTAKIAALEQERDEARRDAETAAAAENANAADLKAARDLLAEQQRAFVVAVEGLRAKAAEESRAALGRHDAALQAVVDDIRKRARGSSSVHVAQALTSTAEATIAVYHDALARHAVREVKNV